MSSSRSEGDSWRHRPAFSAPSFPGPNPRNEGSGNHSISEPPASGWVTRIKLLRRIIEVRGGTCEVLDIGPNRRRRAPGARDRHRRAGLPRQGRTVRAGGIHAPLSYQRRILSRAAVVRDGGDPRASVPHALGRDRCTPGPVQPFFDGWRASVLDAAVSAHLSPC